MLKDELIFCENSFNEKFKNIEPDFVGYCNSTLFVLLKFLSKLKVKVYINQDFYNTCLIKGGESLSAQFRKSNKAAVFPIFKRVLQELGPYYWDDEILTQDKCEYQYPMGNTLNKPNDITEAIERNIGVISCPVGEFTDKILQCVKVLFDGMQMNVNISNIQVKHDACLYLLERREDIFSSIVKEISLSTGESIECVTVGEKCYTDEAIKDNNLSGKDVVDLFNNLPKMLETIFVGNKTRLWDDIKGVSRLKEYRLTVSGGREFRIFFIRENGKIMLLNGFIKKKNKAANEIKKAEKIISKISYV